MSNENNSLTTNYPDLAKEWDYTKNIDITPEEVSYGSHKKVWWKCLKNKNHPSYFTSIQNKSLRNFGCPYCNGKKVCEENALITTHPNLIEEWDPTLNKLTPHNVTAGSNKKVWWRCSSNKKHPVFLSSIKSRALLNSGCPYCAGKKICKANALITTHPELAKEWHPTLNQTTANDVSAGASKKVWWQCLANKDHPPYLSSLYGRSFRSRGCPYCVGKRVCEQNSLKVTHPELAKEWCLTLNEVTTNEVTAGSRKKAWWQCSSNKDHPAFLSSIKSRTILNSGCPYCAGKKVCAENSLATRYPILSKEWHLTLNKSVTPHDITTGSKKKVWWQCSSNKEHPPFLMDIKSRTNRSHGCPVCKQSKGERKILTYLTEQKILNQRQFKLQDCRNTNPLPFDFAVFDKQGELYALLEYDGIQHEKAVSHFGGDEYLKYIQKNDAIKTQYCIKNGINLIRIKHTEYNKIDRILNTKLRKLAC